MLGPVDGPERATRDPYVLAEKGGWAQAPRIYIACGGQDFLVEDNRAFVKLLGEKKIAYEYREVSQRGHTWDFWDDNIRIFLGMLAELDGWKVD
jgi:S-formylglutathione hydrolase FrmB